jgi:hypothetical protein
MATLGEEAKAYIPKQTKNIADLAEVSTALDLKDGAAADADGKEFTYKYIEVDGDEYRVPGKVLKDLKAILEKKPTLKTFSVSKQGQGLNTTYTVIPLD